jgi:hypothetical protein
MRPVNYREFDFIQMVGDAIHAKGYTKAEAESMMRSVRGELIDLYNCGASIEAAAEHVGISCAN